METTVEHRAAVHELPSEDVGAGVVQPHGLSIRGNEENSAPGLERQRKPRRIEELLTSEGSALPCPKRRRAGDRCGWRT